MGIFFSEKNYFFLHPKADYANLKQTDQLYQPYESL